MPFNISCRFLAIFHSLHLSMQLCSCEETTPNTRLRMLTETVVHWITVRTTCFRIGLKVSSKCLHRYVLRMVSFDSRSIRLLPHWAYYQPCSAASRLSHSEPNWNQSEKEQLHSLGLEHKTRRVYSRMQSVVQIGKSFTPWMTSSALIRLSAVTSCTLQNCPCGRAQRIQCWEQWSTRRHCSMCSPSTPILVLWRLLAGIETVTQLRDSDV